MCGEQAGNGICDGDGHSEGEGEGNADADADGERDGDGDANCDGDAAPLANEDAATEPVTLRDMVALTVADAVTESVARLTVGVVEGRITVAGVRARNPFSIAVCVSKNSSGDD